MNSLTIRQAEESDLPLLTELYNHYIQHTPITFDIKPYTVEQRREWFEHYNHTPRHRLLVACLDGVVKGYACSSLFRIKEAFLTSVETSVYLFPTATGTGVGSALYRALFNEISNADVHRAYAAITVPNPSSIALHQKFGFKLAGRFHQVGRKFDRYHDVEWWELALNNR